MELIERFRDLQDYIHDRVNLCRADGETDEQGVYPLLGFVNIENSVREIGGQFDALRAECEARGLVLELFKWRLARTSSTYEQELFKDKCPRIIVSNCKKEWPADGNYTALIEKLGGADKVREILKESK